MVRPTLEEIRNKATIEEALIEQVRNEWEPLCDGATMYGLDNVNRDQIEMWFYQLKMRLRQNQVSIEHLRRLVLRVFEKFVSNGLRDGHGLEVAEQALCCELAVLTALVDAELEAANS